ncbi:MAG: thiamine phosphate synthase [Clostridiales bacterium]|nr:thiamine phosphate synthase [Clostridiales bacterium]
MITSMYESFLAVTNRNLCKEPFLSQIDYVASLGVRGIILREKDLTEEAYEALAKSVLSVCEKHHTDCILHGFPNVARRLGCRKIHVSINALKQMDLTDFQLVGASCHCVQEAQEAQRLGANYIIAGHIFETDCKKGLPGRGLEFLTEVCASVSIPVFAIGGICENDIAQLKACGAAGGCMMSRFMSMTCES